MQNQDENKNIVGLDEVGKGSLFGPVLAGAVILKPDQEHNLIKAGLKDSKELSSTKRAKLVPQIQIAALDWGIGEATAKEIDQLGIREATEQAMLRALAQINIKIDLLLVDGILPIRPWQGKQETLVKGESKSLAIAAASVLAKEARDNIIRDIAKRFPGYGLETNVGYGTPSHRKAIIQKGPTSLHRKYFLRKIVP